MGVDFGRVGTDYGRFRRGYPEELFAGLERLGASFAGQRVVDLGTGTGNCARASALRGAHVTGVDVSTQLVDVARRLDTAAGVRVNYVVGKSERVGLRAAHFDMVTAAQCWWWFDSSEVLAEVRRLLAPRGVLAIMSYDWLPLAGNVVAATEALIESFNPEWRLGGGDGRHPEWVDEVARGGFESIATLSFDACEPFGHDEWRGRIRASAGVGASLAPDRARLFDQELAKLLSARFPGDALQIEHRAYAVLARRSPE